MAASRGEHASCPPGMVVNNRYKIIKECGCGNFSKVFECVDLKDERQSRVALKFLKKEYASDATFERDILKGLGDKDKTGTAKVAKMLDFFVYNRFPTFVFPLKGPSLRSCKLGVTRQNVPQEEMRAFAKEMLQCLKFLHKEVRMVHTDIKPENILLDKALPAGSAGIGSAWSMCDFGSASFLRPDRLDSDLISTRPYRAPEVVMGQGWSTSADIWSMACVFFEVQAGSRLFEIHDDNDHLHAYVSRLSTKLPSIFTRSAKNSAKFFGPDGGFRRPSSKSIRSMNEVLKDTPELLDLLKHMLELDPKRRVTADEALQHPFFTSTGKVSTGRKSSSAERIAEEAAAITEAVIQRKSGGGHGGAAFPSNVLQERASKHDNIDLTKVKKSEVSARPGAGVSSVYGSARSTPTLPVPSAGSNPASAAGKPLSSRFVPQQNTVGAAMSMAKLRGGAAEPNSVSSRNLPAAGRPSNSARIHHQTGTLGSGRYY